jgi:hypothetical protein
VDAKRWVGGVALVHQLLVGVVHHAVCVKLNDPFAGRTSQKREQTQVVNTRLVEPVPSVQVFDGLDGFFQTQQLGQVIPELGQLDVRKRDLKKKQQRENNNNKYGKEKKRKEKIKAELQKKKQLSHCGWKPERTGPHLQTPGEARELGHQR